MQTLWESPIAYRLPSRKLISLIFYKMDTALVLISLAITTSMIFICGFIGLCIYTCFRFGLSKKRNTIQLKKIDPNPKKTPKEKNKMKTV